MSRRPERARRLTPRAPGTSPGILTITGTDPSQFQVGLPGTTTLTAGASTTVSVTFLPTSAGSKTATLNTAASGGASATVTLTGVGQTAGGGGGGAAPIVISEFRTRGSAGTGASDEFVEIYNNGDAPVDISGYRLVGSNNAGGGQTPPRATVPSGVVLPGRAHYLFFNSTATTGYSLSTPGNMNFTTGITDDGGIAIFP